MELSSQDMKHVPGIVAWLEWKATTVRGRQVPDGLRVAANLLDRESARLIPDDTFHLFDRLGGEGGVWPWPVVSPPEFEHANGAVGGSVTGWTRWIAKDARVGPEGPLHKVGHESIVAAMRHLVEQRSTLTAGENPPVDDYDIDLVDEVLTARNRLAVYQALAELTPKVNVAIVRLAAFGSVAP